MATAETFEHTQAKSERYSIASKLKNIADVKAILLTPKRPIPLGLVLTMLNDYEHALHRLSDKAGLIRIEPQSESL